MVPVSSDRLHRRRDLVALTIGTILLRVPAYLASAHLTFDDGVYGASAVAMRAGGLPFRDVFSSQGPLFLPLIWLADVIGFRTFNAPRLAAVGGGVLVVIATYLAGRAITDRRGALVAAVLVTTSASVLWVTAPIASDGVAIAFATATMAALLRWRRDELTTRQAILLGLGIGATISIKALLLPVAVPVALVLLAGRRLLPIVAGAATAIGFHLLLWVPFGPADVWDQAYGYHLDAAGSRTPGANLAKILSTLGDRDLAVVVALLLAIGALVLHRRELPPPHEPRLRSPDVLLLVWLGGISLTLLLEHPMWRPHVSALIPVLALLAARHRPPLRVLVVAGILVLPYHLIHTWELLHPAPYRGSSAEMVEILRTLPEGALAISDDPGIVWRSGRRTPPDLVDASRLRIEAGQITSDVLVDAATQPEVCAVVVRSSQRWGSFDDLPDRLLAAGYRVALEDDLGRRVYVDDACDP
jgi:Dolichyl-phosphate-mannose-protein mannosyltransferase